MKTLLLLTVLTLPITSQAAQKPCELEFKLKSSKAKSYYLNGTSFSNKQLEALKSVCDISLVPLSKEEKIQQFIEKLEAVEKKGSKQWKH